jgi:hypothetical protein
MDRRTEDDDVEPLQLAAAQHPVPQLPVVRPRPAIRRTQGRRGDRPSDDGLARGLGWCGIGLGMVEIAAPRRVYGGLLDKIPFRAIVNKALTVKSGQTHVQRYMKPLLERIEHGEIDPSFIVTHTLPLERAPHAYETFLHKQDGCVKVVLKPHGEMNPITAAGPEI